MHIIKLEITRVFYFLAARRVCIQLMQAGEGVWSRGRQVWVTLGGERKPVVLRF